MKKNKLNNTILIELLVIIFLSIIFFLKIINWNIFVFSSIFIILMGISFVISNYYLLSPLFLFCIFYAKSIGLSPLFYTLSNGLLLDETYYIIVLAYFLFLIGYLIVPKKIINKKKKKTKLDKANLIYIYYALIIISLIATVRFTIMNKDIYFGGQYQSERITALSGNGFLTFLMDMGPFSLCMLFEKMLKNEYPKKKFIILSIIILPLTLLKGFRSALFIPIIIMLLMYNKHKKKDDKQISNKIIIIVGLLGILAISMLGFIRDIQSSQSSSLLINFYSIFRNGIYNFSYIVKTFPSKVEFQHGYSYLINIIMLKPGPDLDFTMWLKEKIGLTFSGGGVTPTILGELYLNFNIVGIFIGMFLLGSIFKVIDNYYSKSEELYYPSFVLFCFLTICSGGIGNIQITFILTSIVYCLLNIINKVKK